MRALFWTLGPVSIANALWMLTGRLTGRLDTKHWAIDAPGVFRPALALVWLAMPRLYHDGRAAETGRV
jgi:hypothetical protein